MTHPRPGACALLAALLLHAPAVRSASDAPPFDVAFRAWELVTGLARSHRDPAIGGECASTFQASAVPALRRQTREQQDAAARACVAAARAACSSAALQRTADAERRCAEFR